MIRLHIRRVHGEHCIVGRRVFRAHLTESRKCPGQNATQDLRSGKDVAALPGHGAVADAVGYPKSILGRCLCRDWFTEERVTSPPVRATSADGALRYAPPVSRWNWSCKLSTISAGDRARTLAAARSIASGRTSSRRQISVTVAALSGVMPKLGLLFELGH